MDKIDFRLGQINLALEIPPFFVNFDKRDFSSMMTRKKRSGNKALFYIYTSRKNQMSKLLLLKALHPDIFIPMTLKIKENINRDEINTFLKSVWDTEKEWKYLGMGVWKRVFFNCIVYIVLIIGNDRWTIRPLVSKKGLLGFGAEIPIAIEREIDFQQTLRKEETKDLMVHDHKENKHYHFTVFSRERFIQLVKKWDYYFSLKERWTMSVRLSDLGPDGL
jgi:hypothetical protein